MGEHQQTSRERRGQNQTDWPPQSGPKRGGQNDGQCRQPCAAAIQQRLNNVIADQFQGHD